MRASQARGLNIQAGNIKISLNPDSLVDPAPHQPMVVVKVSNVRHDLLVVHIVVVLARTVVRPGLLSPVLVGLRPEVLRGRLLGISGSLGVYFIGTDWTLQSYLGLASM